MHFSSPLVILVSLLLTPTVSAQDYTLNTHIGRAIPESVSSCPLTQCASATEQHTLCDPPAAVGHIPSKWVPATLLANNTDILAMCALDSRGQSFEDGPCNEHTTPMIDPKQHRRQRFERVFEQLRNELVEHLRAENMPHEAVTWYRKNLDYNVPGGKLNRGLSVVDSAEILKGRELTDEEYFKTAVLGWCLELLQASFLVADDVMDRSITRRGQPCWYRVERVGVIAINDAFMLEGAIYHLLKKHFAREPYYVHLLELFHDTTFRTEMGQMLDLIIAPDSRIDLNVFSLEKHSLMVRYKTTYYSFYLSVALALRVCGVPDTYLVNGHTVRPYEVALSVLLPLGEYFQVQDDFLDFAGTPDQTGKIGTDIVEGKCTWCVNMALSVATPAQRAVLDANYGRREAGAEERVKEVYEDIGIRERYQNYEERARARIEGLILGVPEPEGDVEGVLRRDVLTAFLNKIYRRIK